MRSFHLLPATLRLRSLVPYFIAAVLSIPPASRADVPYWWQSRHVLNANQADDYALVNQGQAKQIATAAAAEFQALGLSGSYQSMVARWKTRTSRTDDYAPINLGQLKAMAAPFYDSLYKRAYLTGSNHYPWVASPNPANDYALANIGQVKNVFSFNALTPAAPGNLVAHSKSNHGVILTWVNRSTNPATLTIECSSDQGNTWTKIAALTGSKATHYTIGGNTAGSKSGCYRVCASVGPSAFAPSEPATLTPATD